MTYCASTFFPQPNGTLLFCLRVFIVSLWKLHFPFFNFKKVQIPRRMPRPSNATPYLFTHGLQRQLAETCPDAPDAPRMPHGCPASNGPDAPRRQRYSDCEKIRCASTHGKSACENKGYPHTWTHCHPNPTQSPHEIPTHCNPNV